MALARLHRRARLGLARLHRRPRLGLGLWPRLRLREPRLRGTGLLRDAGGRLLAGRGGPRLHRPRLVLTRLRGTRLRRAGLALTRLARAGLVGGPRLRAVLLVQRLHGRRLHGVLPRSTPVARRPPLLASLPLRAGVVPPVRHPLSSRPSRRPAHAHRALVSRKSTVAA